MLGALSSAHTASVAQMDRVSVSEAEGRGFESRRARQAFRQPRSFDSLHCVIERLARTDVQGANRTAQPFRLASPVFATAWYLIAVAFSV